MTSTVGGTERQWQFVNVSPNSNTYVIRNTSTALVIDAYGGATSNNTRVQTSTYGTSTDQQWTITNATGGNGTAFTGASFQLNGVHSGRNLDVNGTRAEGQTPIYLYDVGSTNANQRFILEPASTLTAGTNSTGYNVTIGYTNGNGASYAGLSGLTSTGITGLTASLAAGTLNGTVASPAAGFLTFVITGTPSAAGTANFNFTFGGQSCTLAVATQGPAAIASLTCNVSSAGTLSAGMAASGVTQTISYTGGNTGQYNISAASTGVTGLTATASGSVINGTGTVVLNISGTPTGGGTATFSFTLGGQTCNFPRTVTAGTVSSITNASEPGLDYRIKPTAGNVWVYPTGGATASTQLAVSTTQAGANRQWAFVNTGSNNYAILNAGNNLAMTVQGGNSIPNSTPIIQFIWNGLGTNNVFKLNSINGTPFTGGVTELVPAYSSTATNTGVRVDLDNAGTTDDTKLQIFQANSTTAQRYTLERVATLTSGTAASGYRFTLNYTGGTGTYAAQSATSTGVTGLTATTAAGTFNGNNFITYTVTGTPSASGVATFSLNIGGQVVSINLTVN